MPLLHAARAHTAWLVFGLALAVRLPLLFPSYAPLDAAELTIGAVTLGFVHAPGYPLYLLLGHVFTWLPLGDAAYRMALFSAVGAAAATAMLWRATRDLTGPYGATLGAALFTLGPWVLWNSLQAEVYSLPLALLAGAGALLTHMSRAPHTGRLAVGVGGLFGLAVAAHPSSVLFAPGLALIFVARRVPWRTCLLSGAVGLVAYALPLLYFPLRYAAAPAYNLLGTYDASGAFVPADLSTWGGLWWVLRGAMFARLYAAAPDPWGIARAIAYGLFGVGLVPVVVGLVRLFTTRRGLLLGLLSLGAPFIAFYAVYAAPDRALMLGPLFLLTALAAAFAVPERWLCRARWALLTGIGVVGVGVWGVFAPLVDDRSTSCAEAVLAVLPPNAVVFGTWQDVPVLEALGLLDGVRPDVTLVNTFFYAPADLRAFLSEGAPRYDGRPLFVLNESTDRYLVGPFVRAARVAVPVDDCAPVFASDAGLVRPVAEAPRLFALQRHDDPSA